MLRHIEVLKQVSKVRGTHTVTGQFDLLDNMRVQGPEHLPHMPVFTISALPTPPPDRDDARTGDTPGGRVTPTGAPSREQAGLIAGASACHEGV